MPLAKAEKPFLLKRLNSLKNKNWDQRFINRIETIYVQKKEDKERNELETL